MIKVYVKKQISCPISSPKIKKTLQKFLKDKGIVSDADVYVSLVGRKKMLELAKNFLKENLKPHSVLSFPAITEKGNFAYPPDNILHLGEIVVCYTDAVEEASKEGVLIETKVLELVEHGALHLMGIHHE